VFKDNPDQSRFEWTEKGLVAFADYFPARGALVIPHVEAPVALRGTGAADRLMAALAGHAREKGLKLMPTCGYAVAWFRRHRDAQDVLA
jgi:uncharacterized protein